MFDLKTVSAAVRENLTDKDFRIRCKQRERAAELEIMDNIGDDGYGGGVSATEVRSFLRDNSAFPVLVRVNSRGGLAADGLAIYNAIKEHPQEVTARVEGIAFSAASFLILAADRVQIHENAILGVHRSLGVAIGNEDVMQQTLETLRTVDASQAGMYRARTGASADQVREWMVGSGDGTMFGGQQAVQLGFADDMIPNTSSNVAAQLATQFGTAFRQSARSRAASVRRKLATAQSKR